jgi:hypothetical protein
MTTYTVHHNGQIIGRGMSAIAAAREILTHDGHEYEIGPMPWGGYLLWVTRFSRNSPAHDGLHKSLTFSLENDEHKASLEIAEQVIAARWPGYPEAVTDASWNEMQKELEAE